MAVVLVSAACFDSSAQLLCLLLENEPENDILNEMLKCALITCDVMVNNAFNGVTKFSMEVLAELTITNKCLSVCCHYSSVM